MKFIRTIDENLHKHITVVSGGKSNTYNSLIDMPEDERLAYLVAAMSTPDDEFSPEQSAMARASIKNIILQKISREAQITK